MRLIVPIAVVLSVVVLAGSVFIYVISPTKRDTAPLPSGIGAPARSELSREAVIPYPTEVDLLADRRAAAGALADDNPELRPASDIIPAITDCLQDDDAVVRRYGADTIQRIAMSGDAYSRGLRAAVRLDQPLQDALFDTLSYGISIRGPDGDDARRAAAGAILWLYHDATGPVVEQAMTAHYWDEVADEVRLAIVQTLCDHGYSSQDTRRVFVNATKAYDSRLATTAQRCLDGLP